jgi:L-2-hydroxyglutarate oxidase
MAPDSTRYDIAVIGGGIVGMATAMALAARPRLSLVVLEAESDVAAHQTGHNSGVIHSGLYYQPGSLKAKNCAEGRQALVRFCAERGIAHDLCGKVVVATSERELPPLDELERRGRANGLTGIRRLSGAEIREIEPHTAGVAGLHVPETGIVDFTAVTRAFAGCVREAGGEIRTGERVRACRRGADEIVLETTRGAVRCRGLVACAGLEADRVARLCGVDPGIRIVPFRGEYYELAPARRSLVRNLIYPVPDPRFPFLGVHFTRRIGGEVEAGPNAVLALKRAGYRRSSVSLADTAELMAWPGFWRMAARYWREGMGESWRSFSKSAFVAALRRLMPELSGADLVPGSAGVRAQALARDGALLDDFRIVEADRMIHVLNAPSPAATASISIGRAIAAQVTERLGDRPI